MAARACEPQVDAGNRPAAQDLGRALTLSAAGTILERFYTAVRRRDLVAARGFLDENLVFAGLFQTYNGAGEYLAALTQLLGITERLEVKTIIGEGDEAAIFFELQTRASAEATVLVAEWHRMKDGRIVRVDSAFDGRPYAALFTPK